jgi:hypothetical protein
VSFCRRKPLIFEARQFVQPVDIGELAEWCGGDWYFGPFDPFSHAAQYILVPTRHGPMRADPGDWIIRDINGEFQLCNRDIFEATYDLVDGELADPERLPEQEDSR